MTPDERRRAWLERELRKLSFTHALQCVQRGGTFSCNTAGCTFDYQALLNPLDAPLRALEVALATLCAIPAVQHVLGTDHGPTCRCPFCQAHAALVGLPWRTP